MDYIVENTVGELLDGKNPNQVSELRILDPACGSGSFLIGAYQFLLDWHLEYYAERVRENPKSTYASRIREASDPSRDYALTVDEKKRILLNNIYGVDLDQQAVEVSKLSLLLKMLEDETAQTAERQYAMFGTDAKMLPDLASNIKWGNSLIGSDFYMDKQLPMFDDEEIYRVKAFDWESDAGFGDIMRAGGFDAVIGNPPYIAVQLTGKDFTNYYLAKYPYSEGRTNAFDLFIQKAQILSKSGGFWGFIVPNRLLTNTQLQKLRKNLLETNILETILSFRKAVFSAAVDTVVITCKKLQPQLSHEVQIFDEIEDFNDGKHVFRRIPQKVFLSNDQIIINLKVAKELVEIAEKIVEHSHPLEEVCNVKDGIILGSVKDLFLTKDADSPTCRPWLEGNEVKRYSISWGGRYIRYDHSIMEQELELKRKYAEEHAATPEDYRKMSRSGIWLRTPEIFETEKILTRQNAKKIIGVYDSTGFYAKNSLHCIIKLENLYSLKYILGILNSRLLDAYFQNEIGNTGQTFSQMKIAYVRRLPIRTIDFDNPAEVAQHDHMVALVQSMLDLHKQLPTTEGAAQKVIEQQIARTDREIDALVYQLYDLTEDEIAIVEGRA